MKTCSKCKLEKLKSEFSKNLAKKDGLQSCCRECARSNSGNHYSNNKSQYLERNKKSRNEISNWLKDIKKDLKCERCSETHIACLDFHHLDPEGKEYAIGSMVHHGMTKKRILTEISKCIVLCSNCHRKLHYSENLVPEAGFEPAITSWV